MRKTALIASIAFLSMISSVHAQQVGAAQQFSGSLCGNNVNVTLAPLASNANPQLAPFHGAWIGKWDSGTCNAIVVSDIGPVNATVHYYYGTGVDVPQAGTFKVTDAVFQGGALSFKTPRSKSHVSYTLRNGSLAGTSNAMRTSESLRRAEGWTATR